MTVKEYREKHPNCKYCNHNTPITPHTNSICFATQKRKSKRTAKKCPCYIPAPCMTDIEE